MLKRLITTCMKCLIAAIHATDEERPLADGAEWVGDLNFRTGSMDCGLDPGGLYEEDL